MIGVTTAMGASVAGFLGLHVRLLPQRGGLPAAARGVAVDARLALPGLRHPDQALRQRPGAVVAAAARALPLRAANRSPGATRSSSWRRRC